MSTTKVTHVVFDCKVADRKILSVPIATIEFAPYNPKARTADGKKLKYLIEVIKVYGVLYPLLITRDRELVDGHRRLTACLTLGYTHVDCIVLDMERDKAFTAINTTPEKLGGKGWLEVGRGGGYLPEPLRGQYKELASLVGEFGIDLLIQKRLGLNILQLCKSVASLGLSRGLAEIILLTAKNGLTNKINAELRAKKTREEKMQSLEEIFGRAAKGIV
ncbi:ParB/RepB/Spo0J family partition protein [Paraburkholderia metrosideri]|uniref:ParB-like N-terminal domain-containing protein n=1 Tax=Paraburkholderia metrosideri TaxID=580937 RepID=A0ABM8NC12_9BURK|nr:ParB N-terminal domain-containing protein [Paraburkholderia metrosideri]CAD6516512.1 hypothetical protein LMG28140_00794 [Paraburkholderia metrosideri]